MRELYYLLDFVVRGVDGNRVLRLNLTSWPRLPQNSSCTICIMQKVYLFTLLLSDYCYQFLSSRLIDEEWLSSWPRENSETCRILSNNRYFSYVFFKMKWYNIYKNLRLFYFWEGTFFADTVYLRWCLVVAPVICSWLISCLSVSSNFMDYNLWNGNCQ